MYKVKIQNRCSCFVKSGMAKVFEYETQTEAQEEAGKMIQKMNSNFCHKHEFFSSEQFGNYTIHMKTRT